MRVNAYEREAKNANTDQKYYPGVVTQEYVALVHFSKFLWTPKKGVWQILERCWKALGFGVPQKILQKNSLTSGLIKSKHSY